MGLKSWVEEMGNTLGAIERGTVTRYEPRITRTSYGYDSHNLDESRKRGAARGGQSHAELRKASSARGGRNAKRLPPLLPEDGEVEL